MENDKVIINRAKINELLLPTGGLKRATIEALLKLHGINLTTYQRLPQWAHLFEGPGITVTREKWNELVEISKPRQPRHPDRSRGTLSLF